MTNDTKSLWLYRAADVFWFIAEVLEMPARPFIWAGDALKRRAHFLRFGEHI